MPGPKTRPLFRKDSRSPEARLTAGGAREVSWETGLKRGAYHRGWTNKQPMSKRQGWEGAEGRMCFWGGERAPRSQSGARARIWTGRHQREPAKQGRSPGMVPGCARGGVQSSSKRPVYRASPPGQAPLISKQPWPFSRAAVSPTAAQLEDSRQVFQRRKRTDCAAQTAGLPRRPSCPDPLPSLSHTRAGVTLHLP